MVPGKAGLLLSKPLLKSLGAHLNMEGDELYLAKLKETVPLKETIGGHYEVPLRPTTPRSSSSFQ